MKKQLLIAIAVFTVGFAVGYGITWLLVSGGGPNESSARAEVKSGLKSEGAPAGKGQPKTAASETGIPSGGAKADPKKPEPKPKPEAGGDDEIGTAPVNPSKPAPAEAKPDAGSSAEVETTAAATPDAGPAKPAAGEAKPEPKTWWDKCVGKTCSVNWGQVRGGISIRKGTLEHGTRVDWKLRFGAAARVETVKTTQKTFLVHGVGLGLDGLPTCADVEYKKGGKTVRGIVALKLGSKRISMAPIVAAKP